DLLKGVTLEFARKVGEHGILYGSVTSMDIAEALAAKGYEIDRRRVLLKEPIKEPGEFEAPIKLHREVTTSVKVVVKSEEEAKQMVVGGQWLTLSISRNRVLIVVLAIGGRLQKR